MKKLKILIVDDDEVCIGLLKSILENHFQLDCSIETAENGEVGLESVQNAIENNNPFDITITDDRMPKTSGTEMVEKIRMIDKNVKIIMVTATINDVNVGLKEKIDCLLIKPFFADEMIKKIEELIAR